MLHTKFPVDLNTKYRTYTDHDLVLTRAAHIRSAVRYRREKDGTKLLQRIDLKLAMEAKTVLRNRRLARAVLMGVRS